MFLFKHKAENTKEFIFYKIAQQICEEIFDIVFLQMSGSNKIVSFNEKPFDTIFFIPFQIISSNNQKEIYFSKISE
jgi:hypothetical protein